jgi:RNA ligase
MSLEDMLRTQKDRQQFEGFVIRFADGRRVKVKTEWYLQIAKIMSNLTPIAVWEVMQGGKVPDSYLVQVPEELRPVAEKYQAILEGQYARALLDIERVAAPVLEKYGTDRRALAQYLDAHKKELGHRKAAIFLLLDGKRGKLDQLVRDRIYPRGNQFVADAALTPPPG